jgi:phage-related minor tail protein
MAGNIKGITIEIGGNTTPLQKALSGVNKSIKDTQKELKEVDKLLKVDPKNVELLRQKQDLLNKAVSDTKDKLDKEREALKQLSEQDQTPEVTDKMNQLKRAIIEDEQALDSLKGKQKEFGSVAAQAIAGAGREVEAFGNKIQDVGKKLQPVSAAAGGFAAGMIGLGYSSVTAADDLNTLSKQTGLSTDSLQKMKYASDLVDVSVEDITGAFTKMKKGMAGSPDAFNDLGVSVTNADGSMRDAESVFNDTLKALSQIDNETERDQKAYEIFGKSADQLAGIIDDGGAALQAYGEQAEELGLIMSGDTLDSLNEINDKVDQSKAQISAAAGELGATIAEGILPLVDPIVAGIQKVTEFVQNLTPAQTNLILVIAGVIAVLAPLLSIIGGIISTVGTIMTMAPAISAALTALSGPIGLVIAAIAALIAIIIVCIAHWDEIKAKVKEVWDAITTYVTNLKEDVSAKWNEIKQNIADKIQSIKTDLQEKWSQIKSDAVQKIEDTKSSILQKFADIKDGIKKKIEDIKGFFSNLKLKFPEIEMPKLPHFSLSGEFSLNPPSVPHLDIDWYAKAMNQPYYFSTPTVMQTPYGLLGAGEAGGEFMYGKNSLMNDIQNATAANNESLIEGMYVAFTAALQQADIRVEINEREFGRIVREARA